MAAGVCCMKFLLIFVNVCFGLVGLVLLGAGIFVKVGANDMIKGLLGSALDSIPSLPTSFNLQDAVAAPAEGLNIDFAAILSSVAIALIILGLFLLIVAVLGSCGACCSNTIMLVVYAVIVLVLFLVQMILVIMLFTGALNPSIQDFLKSTITNEYGGIDDFQVYSLAWNYMMLEFKCCGLTDYHDFDTASKWNKVRTFDLGFGIKQSVTLVTPITCCKMQGTFPQVTPLNQLCAWKPTDFYSWWNRGCWGQINDFMAPHRTTAVGAAAGLLAFQGVVAVFAILIAYFMNKEKKNTTV